MKFDAIDIKILNILQKDSQITKAKLADAVGLSVSPCWERVKRLEKNGVIKNYQAILDINTLSQHSTFIVHVFLQAHKKSDWERFSEAMNAIPEVVECYAMGGSIDYILKVVVPSTEHYQALFEDLLEQDIGIERYNGHMVTRCTKQNKGIDVSKLLIRDKK